MSHLLRALVPFWAAMRTVLGKNAKNTTVTVAGGLFMQEKGYRNTSDVDVVVEGLTISRKQLRDAIVRLDKEFTINTERRRAVVSDQITNNVVPIDIIDGRVTGFMPIGTVFSTLQDTDVPMPTAEEVIKMKIISSSEHYDENKGIHDINDGIAENNPDDTPNYIGSIKHLAKRNNMIEEQLAMSGTSHPILRPQLDGKPPARYCRLN